MPAAKMLATSARRSSGVRSESSNDRMGQLLVELPTTTFAWRPVRCLADSLVNSVYLLTYPLIRRFDGNDLYNEAGTREC